MCGICGIYAKEGIKADVILRMNNIQKHRGPDDEGYLLVGKDTCIMGGEDTPERVYKSNILHCPYENIFQKRDVLFKIGIANRRLSIIDLSPSGHQPLCNENKSIWVVHNGEIYNFKDLRKVLIRRGHTFFSKTDTEVIVHGYEEWGEEIFNILNGMWAFAILDNRKKKIILSRDRYGIKPLYYFFNGKYFIFSSEIKGILATNIIKGEPDWKTVEIYLKSGLVNYNKKSFFRNIEEVNPGYFVEFDIKNEILKKVRYYEIPLEKIETEEKESIEKFKEIFFDSVKLRIISDVPVGSCLSGGLDSTSIVCVVNKFLKENKIKIPGINLQKTFSARYNSFHHDEGIFIEEVRKYLDIEAHFIYPEPEDLLEEIFKLIWHQEEPFVNTSIYAQWCVFKLMRDNKIKVSLDGQGSDELLAGYLGYKYSFLAQLMREFRFIKYFKEIFCFRKMGEKTERLMRKSLRDFLPRWFLKNWYKIIAPRKIPSFPEGKTKDIFLNTLLRDFLNSLIVLLKYEDRNSMAHSIEARVPFLDYRLVDFLFSLPADFKIRNGYTKWILREAMKGIIPEKIRLREDKIGFSTPEDEWFRNELREFIEDLINSKKFKERGVFDLKKAQDDFKTHLEKRKNRSDVVWRYINLELWFQKFID